MFKSDLIFDIGMHNGTDTEFYLRKGFRVVGVDANPVLTNMVKEKLSEYIESDRLFVENYGINSTEEVLKFYQNEDCDEWSSFDQHLGTRQNTKFNIIDVACKRLDYFIGKYGMPYFLKIDVEGVDAVVARELLRWFARPKFISVEDAGIDVLIALYEIGVRSFKFINQLDIRNYVLPSPPHEGQYVEHVFGVASSGPFGEELPGEWLGPEEAFAKYLSDVRPPGEKPKHGWWDIHGMF